MNVYELIGERVLLQKAGYHSDIEEFRVLEVSPTGNYTRLMNANGNKFWRKTTELAFLETLEAIEPNPRKKVNKR